MAKDSGIKFSKTGGGWGNVAPPQKKNGFSSEHKVEFGGFVPGMVRNCSEFDQVLGIWFWGE